MNTSSWTYKGGLALLLAGLSFVHESQAAEIQRANTTANLNTASAWEGGIIPGPEDVAVWGATLVTPASCTNFLGGDLSLGGIKVTTPAVPVLIRTTGTAPNTRVIMLGAAGIDMSAATQDLRINNNIWATNHQVWNIPAGRVFMFGNSLELTNDVTVDIVGEGTIAASGANFSYFRLGMGPPGTATVNQKAGSVLLGNQNAGAVALNIGRMDNNPSIYNLSGGVIRADTNTAIIRIGDTTNAIGTLRITGGEVWAYQVDVAFRGTGTLTLDGGVLNVSGLINVPRMPEGRGVVNLNGGTLTAPRIVAVYGTNVGQGTFNFNGGTLIAASGASNLIQGLTAVNVAEGGAIINTAGNDVSIQGLAHGGAAPVDGGLLKTGAGILTITSASTYNGPTLLNAGGLTITTPTSGGGAFSCADGTTLKVVLGEPGTSLSASALVLGESTGATLAFELTGTGNPTAPPIRVTNLTTHGSVPVHITGTGLSLGGGQFPLIQYSGSIGGSGFGAFHLMTLPAGVNASLVNNVADQSVDLLVEPRVPTTPTNLTVTVSGGQIELSWPENYLGWLLQVQTNGPGQGVSSNWVTVPDSGTTNRVFLPLDPNLGSAFARMVLP